VNHALRSLCLNALWLDPGVSGGTETYLRQLGPLLARRRPEMSITVVTTRKGGAELRGSGWADFASIRVLPTDDTERVRRNVAEQIQLPLLAARERWDVLHNMANRAPSAVSVPSVLTLHDLIFFRETHLTGFSRLAMRTLTKRAVRRADAVITLTAAARADIETDFDLDPGRVFVVPHGVGRPQGVDPAPEAELRARFELGSSRVVVCVAVKRPHKNQELLIRALPDLPGDVRLVCPGHEEGYERRLRELVAELGLEQRVRLPGYVTDEELEGLWRLASCAAFPTLAEGFGFPVIEAMQRGVPVACSDIPVLREVGGHAAIYFDPHDPAAAAGAIAACMRNGARSAAGRRRSADFSWERSAERTLEVYERVASGEVRR
jgi:glycosyltransferase involved in cell wall biosynthesis